MTETTFTPIQQALNVLLSGLLTVALPILAREFVRWLRTVAAERLHNLRQSERQAIEDAVRMAVTAIEQASVKRYVADKKGEAMGIARRWLAQQGIGINLLEVSDLIEAAVWQEFNSTRDYDAVATGASSQPEPMVATQTSASSK